VFPMNVSPLWQSHGGVNVYERMKVSDVFFFIDGPEGWRCVHYDNSWGICQYGPDYTIRGIHMRHMGQADALMLDGRAESFPREDIPDDSDVFWTGL